MPLHVIPPTRRRFLQTTLAGDDVTLATALRRLTDAGLPIHVTMGTTTIRSIL